MVPAIIGVVVLIFFIIILFGLQAKRDRLKDEYYGILSERYGWKKSKEKEFFLAAKTFQLEGVKDGYQIRIFELIKRSGKQKRYFTNIQVPLELDFKFKIGKENFFTHMIKLVGFTDIEFSNKEVDHEYLFKSDNEEAFKQFISSDHLTKLNTIKKKFHGVLEAEDGVLTYSVRGEINSDDKLAETEAIIDLMLSFSKS